MIKALGKLSLLTLAIAQINVSFAEDTNNTLIEEITIIGDSSDAKALPGSAFVISKEELQKFQYTDINRMVRKVPGVYLQEEDGFGLRPNIGIRGAGAERSSKISLMEDGVLISPAPYSAPSAYYFPTSGRMSGVEILKGPSSLKYGPSTVGGAVNLISTRIPEESQGLVSLEAGQDSAFRVHANYGYNSDTLGWLVETHQNGSDGFKEIDRSNRDTGFYVEDYLAKLRLNTDSAAKYYQQLDVKVQYSEELSDETYLGLTDKDFAENPDRRYGLSKEDDMTTRHSGVNLRHTIELSDDIKISTTAYYNKFKRDWFKVKGVGGLVDKANQGDALSQAILDGTASASVNVKHNNRSYDSKGIQTRLDWQLDEHQIEVGARIHKDEVDRYQPEDIFDQIDGQLVFSGVKLPSSSNNRVEDAEALSFYVEDRWSINDQLDMNLSVRYEDIETTQTRYSDQARQTIAQTRNNSVDQLLWGWGMTYQLNDSVQLLAGVHSGFAPSSPSAKQNIDPETSTNYEAGFRFDNDDVQASVIGFFSDYDSTVTNCSVAFPCSGQTLGSVSQGESEVQGLELAVDVFAINNSDLQVPVSISYTYTEAEITNPQQSSAQSGDVYEYLPENVFNAQVGLELSSGWNTYVNASYVDEMCTDNSVCGRSGADETFVKTDDLWVIDFASHYPINTSTQLYLKVDNVFDKRAIVSRSPDGARPNKPRTATVGVKFQF